MKIKLSDCTSSIIGSGDDFHYRSVDGKNSVIHPSDTTRLEAVWLLSENNRIGYRGIVLLVNDSTEGWIATDTELFDQSSDGIRSFKQLLEDAKELDESH
jgi:hypothetical protein